MSVIFGGMHPEVPEVTICPVCRSLRRPHEACKVCTAPPIQYISMAQYLGPHPQTPKYAPELTPQLIENATDLLRRVNSLLQTVGRRVEGFRVPPVTSGWRPRAYNWSIGGSSNSKHITCQAIDLGDPNNDFHLGQYLTQNQSLLIELDLAIEMTEYTPGWVHIQRGAPPSGKTVYQPYEGPPRKKP